MSDPLSAISSKTRTTGVSETTRTVRKETRKKKLRAKKQKIRAQLTEFTKQQVPQCQKGAKLENAKLLITKTTGGKETLETFEYNVIKKLPLEKLKELSTAVAEGRVSVITPVFHQGGDDEGKIQNLFVNSAKENTKVNELYGTLTVAGKKVDVKHTITEKHKAQFTSYRNYFVMDTKEKKNSEKTEKEHKADRKSNKADATSPKEVAEAEKTDQDKQAEQAVTTDTVSTSRLSETNLEKEQLDAAVRIKEKYASEKKLSESELSILEQRNWSIRAERKDEEMQRAREKDIGNHHTGEAVRKASIPK